jgi:hypothetical protein
MGGELGVIRFNVGGDFEDNPTKQGYANAWLVTCHCYRWVDVHL